MEHGFYHPDFGYWQATSEVDETTRNAYPSGTVEVPIKPGSFYEWDGSDWVYTPPSETDLLEAERSSMSCSRFQAKAALQEIGRLDEVQSYIANDADEFVALAWADAGTFWRNSPTIKSIGSAMGLSETEIDDLFRQAMSIRA